MILWNTRRLADLLRDNTLPEKDKALYMGVIWVLLALAGVSWFEQVQPSWQMLAVNGLHTGFTLAGFIYLYKINQAGDGQRFVERLVCISLPLTIRILLMAVAVLIVVMVFFYQRTEHADPLLSVATTLFVNGIFYWRAGQWIKYISSGAPS